jgi:short-subunit dehydrogenase
VTDFKHSTVVITGASRGIGKQIALGFARETDHSLLLIAREQKRLEEAAHECRRSGFPNVESVVCDLTDSDQIARINWPDNLPKAGVLVNNAGSFLLKPLSKTTPEEFRKQWILHSEAAFHIDRTFLPQLKEQERGLVVHVSSMGALTGQSRSGAYSSSKHALLGYSRSLRQELLETNIAVTALNLGQTWSHSWEGIDVEPAELIDPDDVAKLIVQLTRLSPRTVVEEMNIAPQHGRRSPD